jgi:phosphatidylethanolamine-binding protein (PEBP) family uncharacterized protein
MVATMIIELVLALFVFERDAGLTKHDLLRAIRGHVLAQAQLVGIYKR